MKKKIKIMLAAAVLLIVAIAAFMQIRGSDSIDASLEIKNSSKEQFEYVGIVWEDHALVCKTDQTDYFMPEEITEKADSVSVIGIKYSGEVICSGSFSLPDNKSTEIKEVRDSVLILDINTGKADKKISLPDMKNWVIETDEGNVRSTFSCDTEYRYTLYILGKGGSLGVSDALSKGEEATASWEDPKTAKTAWVMLEFQN